MVGSSFLVVSLISLAFSLVLYVKSRTLKKVSKGLAPTVFNITFNVFDPYSERSRTVRSDLFFYLFSPLTAFLWAFIITFVLLLPIIEAGLVGDLAIFILCLGPMMIDEGTEVYSCANTLTKAVARHTSFGQGDISILLILKKTIGRMSAYYLLLSVLFAALFLAMPYAFPAVMLAYSQFISLIMYGTIGIPVIAPLVAVALFVLFWLAIFEAAKRVKVALFGFPSSHPSDWETSEEAAIARQPFHEH